MNPDPKGVSTGTSHLLEIFNSSEEKDAKHSAQEATKAENVDWESVKYWREMYKIPGDEHWEGDDSLLDGIELIDATEEVNGEAD